MIDWCKAGSERRKNVEKFLKIKTMEKYLGVKLIEAEYWPRSESRSQDGYNIQHDGMRGEWMVKDVFEKAYRKIDGLTFGLAIEALKLGEKVTRSTWYGSEAGPVVMMQVPDENSKMTKPYLYMSKNSGKDVFPLDLSCESVLAEDWIIIE